MTETRPPPPLFELESDIMDEVWALGEANVRTVMEALNARADKPRAYTTIMTTMARLNTKGLLRRRREGKTDVYEPTMTHQAYLDARARADVSALVDEYGDTALVYFARQMADLDPKRREQLRRLARRA